MGGTPKTNHSEHNIVHVDSPPSHHLAVVENQDRGNLVRDVVDPMVVVFGGSKKSGSGVANGFTTSTSRHSTRRRHCVMLATASIVCGVMIVWNHLSAVMLPSGVGISTLKFSPTLPNDSSEEREAVEVKANSVNEGQESLPVSRTDQLPSSLLPILPLRAAEALQCRESVVSFVINATDAKDECEGLRKAFDKTCGDQPEPTPKSERSSQIAELAAKQQHVGRHKRHGFNGHRVQKQRDRKQQQKKKWAQNRVIRRRLSEKRSYALSTLKKWKLRLYETRRVALDLWRYWFGYNKDFLFAEDEILKVWKNAESIVMDDLDDLVHVDLLRQLREDSSRRRRLQGTNAISQATSTNPINETWPSTNHTTKPINLDLPTSRKHASGGVIQDVLMLHQGDKLINQTNAAAQEAAVSSKAMSDTAAAVSAVLNDPSSIEARTCCTSILNVYHENCSSDNEEEISDRRLFLIVLVMALCGMVKSLIRHYRILWLPEAAGCIIVGIMSGYVLMFFPHHDISFDGNWFLRIMVPPIIFEAALSIDKKSFNRHVVPIILYAVFGTLLATFITAEILHRGSTMLSAWCTPIPYIESLTFGALISSIDPIAVLSVLSNMGMTDKDTIYVLIFGESLLNDGVAIVLFDTLVHFLDEHLIVDEQAVTQAIIHFCVVAIGSLMVGALAGYAGTVYFWLFQDCQTPLVEVLMFFCWALLPYYVCDGIGWSGIVSAVATGFIMDIHIVGQRQGSLDPNDGLPRSSQKPIGFRELFSNICSNPDGHLSAIARAHIGFVTGLIATTMETAIFAYLGLFLFSHRYHWSFFHAVTSILACCLSRAIMIPSLSFFVNMLTKLKESTHESYCKLSNNSSGTPSVSGFIGHKMQFVLCFAGLRGAMSFALVESIPLYDSVSGEGSPFKPELKAMTSACIMFTVFVLGGYTFYVMESLGMAPGAADDKTDAEFELVGKDEEDEDTLEPLTAGSNCGTAHSRRRVRPTIDQSGFAPSIA